MNCTQLSTILDERRETRLTAAERAAVDAHLLGCMDCAAAWHAHAELVAIAVPVMAPALLRAVLGASLNARPAHAARRHLIMATALLAGAALAAISGMQLRDLTRDVATPPPTAARTQSGATPAPAPAIDRATPPRAGGTTFPVDATAIEVFIAPIVRTAPDYPPAAQERGLEGSVTLQFDTTAKGAVENVKVVDSTDAIFEKAAADAVAQWKYLPRIAAGKRVAALAQKTVIRFQLDRSPPPAVLKAARPQEELRGFSSAMQVAWERVSADDFRGAELQLDEARALYRLNGFDEGAVWDFYAYLYTVQGNYDRAIDAYETGIAAYARGGVRSQGSWFPLANLYYARHQYDLALRTLVTYKQRIKGTPAELGGTPMADEFIARLAALGVTEATLPGRR